MCRATGVSTASNAPKTKIAEIGRVTKIEKLPCDMVIDWRSVVSNIGPRTSPSTAGAIGQS